MTDLLLCRACAKKGDNNLLKLFDGSQTKPLRQLKELTGKILKYEENLPQYICQSCLDDLQKLFEFRIRLLTVQYYYTTPQYLKKLEIARQNRTQQNNKITIDRIENTIKAEGATAVDDLVEAATLNDSEISSQEFMDIEVNPDSTTVTQISSEKPVNKQNRTLISCEYCGKVFTKRGSFYIHRRRHEGVRPYPCDLCSQKFYSLGEMKLHRMLHTGERPHACKQCGKAFRTHGSLNDHLVIHSNIRAFACELCYKSYKRSYELKKHMITHTGESRHNCTLCGKVFQTNAKLLRHNRSYGHIQNVKFKMNKIP